MLSSFYFFFFWSQLLYFPSEYSLLKLYLLVVDVCILLLDGHVEQSDRVLHQSLLDG